MPIKDSLPGSKPHLMLPGAISFQSKANKLPQSTTQVLINIQTFAFKSSPVYRSFPSICETWNPLCCVTGGFKCLFERGNVNRGTSDCSWTLFSSDTVYMWASHLQPPCMGTRRSCCRKSILDLCWWSAQTPHYSHHGSIVSHFLICYWLLYLNIKYLGNWAYLVCILMAHTTLPAEFLSVQRAALPIIIDQTVRGVKKRQTCAGTAAVLQDRTV